MALKVLIVLCGVAMVAWLVAIVTGINAGIVLAIAGRLAWLLGVVLALRARAWGWAALILVFGVVPGFWYAFVRLRGPQAPSQPISVLRG